MRRHRLTLACLACLAPVAARGQAPDTNDRALMEAAHAVYSFDYFATRCQRGKGFSPGDSARIATWTATNEVELVRARLRELERDDAQKPRLDQVRRKVEGPPTGRGLLDCQFATVATRVPAAQFDKVAPQLLVALRAHAASAAAASASGQASATTPTTAGAAASGLADSTTRAAEVRPPGAVAPGTALAEAIDSFGFDSRVKMGIGGFLTTDIFPVVLFRNGEALMDVEGLAWRGGLESHRRANPDDWTRWRRMGGALQVQSREGWRKLAFNTTYGKLPDGFVLDGYYRALSGAGTVAVGGSQEVTAWDEYTFARDGRVVRGGGAGGSAESGNASVATSSVAANRRGRYRVEGLTLHIAWDDGSAEARILVTDPSDPRGAIWLDGTGYVQRRR